MPHCLWIHQRLAVIRSAEAGGIDGDQVRGGCEVRPGWLEGVYAFRPRAHQDRVGTFLAAFGVADRQSVNRDCLRVNQGAHRHSLSGRTVGRVVSRWFTIPPYRASHLGVLEPRGASTVWNEPGVLDKTTWSVMP